MSNVFISEMCQPPMENQQVELVERKGIGHPDTMCDAIMEQVSIDLCKEYKAVFNRVLHHNIDKGMVIAGRSEPYPGGGRVLEMMRILFGDRATSRFDGNASMSAGSLKKPPRNGSAAICVSSIRDITSFSRMN